MAKYNLEGTVVDTEKASSEGNPAAPEPPTKPPDTAGSPWAAGAGNRGTSGTARRDGWTRGNARSGEPVPTLITWPVEPRKKAMKPDDYQMAIMERTAQSFQRLAAVRGISSSIRVNRATGNYEANGEDCSTTTFGLYDWLNRQPGVKP